MALHCIVLRYTEAYHRTACHAVGTARATAVTPYGGDNAPAYMVRERSRPAAVIAPLPTW